MQKISEKLEWVVGGLSVVLALLLLLVAAALTFVTVKDFLEVSHFGVNAARPVVLGVLNTLILLELVRLFLRIEKDHVFQAPLLIDTGLVFVVRDILIALYDHNHDALLVQLVVLGAFVVAKLMLSKVKST
jgi:uncharacterized membrane protein (DUF373 family)